MWLTKTMVRGGKRASRSMITGSQPHSGRSIDSLWGGVLSAPQHLQSQVVTQPLPENADVGGRPTTTRRSTDEVEPLDPWHGYGSSCGPHSAQDRIRLRLHRNGGLEFWWDVVTDLLRNMLDGLVRCTDRYGCSGRVHVLRMQCRRHGQLLHGCAQEDRRGVDTQEVRFMSGMSCRRIVQALWERFRARMWSVPRQLTRRNRTSGHGSEHQRRKQASAGARVRLAQTMSQAAWRERRKQSSNLDRSGGRRRPVPRRLVVLRASTIEEPRCRGRSGGHGRRREFAPGGRIEIRPQSSSHRN
jgi:hypothetical protein